jgi:hypothetical protein
MASAVWIWPQVRPRRERKPVACAWGDCDISVGSVGGPPSATRLRRQPTRKPYQGLIGVMLREFTSLLASSHIREVASGSRNGDMASANGLLTISACSAPHWSSDEAPCAAEGERHREKRPVRKSRRSQQSPLMLSLSLILDSWRFRFGGWSLVRSRSSPSFVRVEALRKYARETAPEFVNNSASDRERAMRAAATFFGFYHVITRSRVEHCAKLGVDLTSFANLIVRKHHRQYNRALTIVAASGTIENRLWNAILSWLRWRRQTRRRSRGALLPRSSVPVRSWSREQMSSPANSTSQPCSHKLSAS